VDVMEAEVKQKKLTKRQQQALETEARIYKAATEVINEKGLNNTSIEDITTRAGVAQGSFYTYFKSKEDVVLYTFQNADNVYERAFEKIPAKGFVERIVTFAKISSQEYEKNGKGIIKAFTSLYFMREDFDFYPEGRILICCMKKIVQGGIDEGVLSEDQPVMFYVNRLLTAMVGTETMWCFDKTGAALSDMMSKEVELVARGLSL